MTALRFVGITKRYGVRTILDDVSLCVGSAGIVALAGVNGSGKSTLYRIAAGFVRQDAGRVFMDRASGTLDLSALAPTERVLSGLRYVPQDRRVVCDLSTVENLRLAANACDDVFEVVAELRLGALFKKQPNQMTAAERGFLLLTIVRAARPAFVIVDEPFAGLDRLQRWHCIAILRHLSESGMGILLTDHDGRALLDVATTVHIIERGRIVYSDDARSAAVSPVAKRLYFRAHG
ncbi:MAG: ATP-binding cassette domain-containing protein [Candidatus Cybelea sp.]|jgi:lipopolysaccharide export system ATP-binding protein